MNDIENADPGELFVKDGEVWGVIGFHNGPTVCLQKIGTTPATANRDSLVPDSGYANNWKRVEPGQMIELLREYIRAQ